MADPGAEDERLAMRLQVEEGIPSSQPPNAIEEEEEVFVPPPLVAEAMYAAAITANGSDKENSDDEDSELARELQLKEIEEAVRTQDCLPPVDENLLLAADLNGQIRMGAAPYETTARGQRVRDRIGNSEFATARQRAVIELPPSLAGSTTASIPTTTSLPSPESSLSEGKSETTEKIIRRHLTATPVWFDVARPKDGDPVVLALLGNYTGPHPNFEIDWKFASGQVPILSRYDKTIFGEEVVAATIRELPASTHPVAETVKDIVSRLKQLTISFREAVLQLPFCLRFQLERCMFMDMDNKTKNTILVRRVKEPKTDYYRNKIKNEMVQRSRKMMMVFMQEVLPPLLQNTERLGSSLTLQELFADELWNPLRQVKEAIVEGKEVRFMQSVEEAIIRALELVQGAERLCQCKEEDLVSSEGMVDEEYLQLIRKRSCWPIGEYRARFSQEGVFQPKGFAVVNKAHAKRAIDKERENGDRWTFERAIKLATPETRRGIREYGWSLRDRFLVFSDVPFTDFYKENLSNWCKDRATLCGRQYEYLFDKGAAKPNVWFLAPSDECSREEYLSQLGSFSNVEKSKLGERISLAFSITKPFLQLDINQIVAIPEVVRNGYRFTDGCGVMGIDIARRIREIDGDRSLPIQGSIQIRLGGVKGMLTVKKDFPKDKIGVRPSMCKFPSNHRLLEVKAVAKQKSDKDKALFFPALLIMHELGVPAGEFLDLQRRAWAEIAVQYDMEAVRLLQDPIDYKAISRYMQRVVQGRKEDGKFALWELEEIVRKMEEAKKSDFRMNLHCSITLMQAVPDEHDILEEGEVLVGSGRICGDILILRPPCNVPGDIQRVRAVSPPSGFGNFVYKALANTVVFSVKGDRPLADKLGGGDYDGDEFYIIDEAVLVNAFKPTSASDFGTQKEGIQEMISIPEWFKTTGGPPVLDDQLSIFQQFMENGDIVSSSHEAWARLADRYGPGDERCLTVASVCQRALDARKNTCVFTPSEMAEIDKVLSETHPDRIDTPRWRGGPAANPSNSILGALFDKWEEKINAIKATRNDRNQPTLSSDSSFCEGSIVSEVTQATLDTRQFDIQAGQPAMSGKTGTELLIDATFGRKDPLFEGSITPIDFKKITEVDRQSLVKMVLHEYEASLKSDAEKAGRRHKAYDYPREYEVFLVKQFYLDPEEFAVCVPIARSDREVEFRLKDRILPINEPVSRRRVTAISPYSRILDSLLKNPVPQLMQQAMRRSGLVDAVCPDSVRMNASHALLNKSQQKAVATILSDDFRYGFFAIQGPFGTGKTSTIVEMVCAAKRALILAPSNAAVANVARRLIEKDQFGRHNVVVWGDNCHKSVRFLNPKHRHNDFAQFLKGYTAEEDEREMELKLSEFTSRVLRQGWLSFSEAEEICSDGDGYRSVAKASVVLCTLNTAGSVSLRKAVMASKRKLELCVLDEGSQCSEAEFYIATTFPGVKRMVVVGDPKQLGPTVLSGAAGYGESFLGNILTYNPEKVHLLDTQYRMDPSPILKFVNSTFYGNRLVSDNSVKNRLPVVKHPYLFVSTSEDGYGTEERVNTSWINEYELGVIKNILRNDADVQSVLEGTEDARIIVITPYKEQETLLRKVLKSVRGVKAFDISTVDSFQGQEGDIVIVSTVRTGSVGFSDNAHRLCVQLTRHKRVLRVVGDLQFFKSIASDDSILRQLAIFSEKGHLVEDANIASAAWRRPKWRPNDTSWLPTMVSRFYDCVHKMERRDKNVAFNTLYELATPQLNNLKAWPVESEAPRWQISELKDSGNVAIVWLAKHYQSNGDAAYVGKLEAHFAGSREACQTFVQKHGAVPRHSACPVKRDMSGVKGLPPAEPRPVHSTQVDIQSWTVTSDLQNATNNDEITELPEGLFSLDYQQQQILSRKPPLLLESRSGTGKTNVLFQHALSYLRQNLALTNEEQPMESSILFVTVSSRLQEELKKRYEAVSEISQNPLPPITFLSLKDLLDYLLETNGVPKRTKAACTYLDFVYQRSSRSHQKEQIEASLVQNEIGGVITGSLKAAKAKRPLTREEYLEMKRSNIPNKTDEGKAKRELVYKEFIQYSKHKKENNEYDIGDIVLELVQMEEKLKCQDFVSAYLDEVQDFSYAMIYLICSIAGKLHAHWVAAGDTAQMISPGCAFKFAGLRQTLLAVKPDIELAKVEKLRRNYRMTKSVLQLGNSILASLKKHFPGQIEYAQPEVPMKDLGLRVFLVKWNKASSARARLGLQQAIIYSGSGSRERKLTDQLAEWTDTHPLTISVLEAKGLEFDDIIVAFHKDRSAWDASKETQDSLKNLRELYVAVTRAKKRVVILTRDTIDHEFFTGLSCGLEPSEASVALLDFDKETSAEEWRDEGFRYFREEKYNVAENCFIRANEFGWSNWAQGKHFHADGRKVEAKIAFRRSSKAFYEGSLYNGCLDVMRDLAEIEPWDKEDNQVLDAALEQSPNHLPREWTVRFAIVRDEWSSITIGDLQNRELGADFRKLRNEPRLKDMIRKCPEEDRAAIKRTLPALIADYCYEKRQFADATELFIAANEVDAAVKATDKFFDEDKKGDEQVTQIVGAWKRTTVKDNNKIKYLLSLFKDPKAASKMGAVLLKAFGHDTVRLAVRSAGLPATTLHDFDKNEFRDDVEKALAEQYGSNPIEIVEWYVGHEDRIRANEHAETRLSTWLENELIRKILGEFSLRPKGIEVEIQRRGHLLEAVRTCLVSEYWDLPMAEQLSNMALTSLQAANENANGILTAWLPLVEGDARAKKAMRQQKGVSSKVYLLLKMFTNPENPGKENIRKACMSSFGKELVKQAVQQGAPYLQKSVYDVLRTYDSLAFESEKPAPPPQPASPPSQRTQFEIGDRVRVSGLTSAKGQELNGKSGTVESYQQQDRFGVRIPLVNNLQSIKRENITKLGFDDMDDGGNNGKSKPKSKSQQDSRKSTAKTKQDNGKPAAAAVADSSSDDSDEGPPVLTKRPIIDSSDEDDDNRARQSSKSQAAKKKKRATPAAAAYDSDSSDDTPARQAGKKPNNSQSADWRRDDFDSSESSDSSVPDLVNSQYDKNSSDEENDLPALLIRDGVKHNSSSDSSSEDEPPPATRGRSSAPFASSSSSSDDNGESGEDEDSEDEGPPALAQHNIANNDTSSSSESDSSADDFGGRRRRPAPTRPATQPNNQSGNNKKGGNQKRRNNRRGRGK